MEKIHNEPDVKRQDYNAFVNELRLFHQNRGTPFRHLPKINGREIDLLQFYNSVTSLGGLQKVVENQKWNTVAEILKLPKACVNFSLGLRKIYIRYLGHYEKIHFMGEDPDADKNQSSESHGRKAQFMLFQQVPMVYNFLQHEIPNSTRSVYGLNQKFSNRSDYDKICLSLLSGLPNEQELALNVCTILSNEGNYMLHLEQAPKLVDLLLAQIGIWPKDDDSLLFLFMESWKDLKGKNLFRFWRSTLDLLNKDIVQLLGLELGNCDPEDKFFNLESDLGALNLEGQRVLRVALIFHNLSYERNNVPVLVENSSFIRFVLLCVHSNWVNLKQIAYDTLSNLASEMKLCVEKDICSRIIFQTVIDGIKSPDRYMNIRSMDILSQLCNCELNEDLIPSILDDEAYQQLVSFLTVHDVMLLFYTLEALYALSDLGKYACDKIVCVHRCIEILVCLLTLEPNMYGASGHVNMKVVETLMPVEYEVEPEIKPAQAVLQKEAMSPPAISLRISNDDVDSETFAYNWLKATYENTSGGYVARNEIYAEYVNFCSKSGRKGVVNANVFAGCVKRTFPSCGLKRVESVNGTILFYHYGIQKKIYTSQTGPPLSKCSTISPNTQKVPVQYGLIPSKSSQKEPISPILKAQLSAPPRSNSSSPSPSKIPVNSFLNDKSVSSSPIPNQISFAANVPVTSGSSTLIKSLLANKVQQRNMHRQVIPHNVSKMVIYSPDKGTLGRGIVGSSATMVRCVGPNTLTGVRTPIQSRIFSSRGRVLAAGNSKIFKASPIFASKLQQFKKPLIALPATRINGIQKDVRLEICPQETDLKSISDVVEVQTSQISYVKNHLAVESSIGDELDCENSLSSKGVSQPTEACENSMDMNLENSYANSASSVSNSQDCCSPKKLNGLTTPNVNTCSSELNSSQISESESNQPNIIPASNAGSTVLNSQTDSCSANLKDKVSARAPLLNGLLDRGKLPISEIALPAKHVPNGTNSCENLNSLSKENENSTPLEQSLLNSPVKNNSSPSEKPVVINALLVNSCDSPLPTVSVNAASSYQTTTQTPTKESQVSSPANKSVLVSSNQFQADNDLLEICSQRATLSGTIEVQPDQKGVVRLHIESPDNSNQGSDLSSITDIAKTLECASKAISRTNEECNKPVPYCGACETTATVTVITTNTPTLAHSGQQIIVVTPSKNQPQLHIQSPNIKFRIVHSAPKVEDSAGLGETPKVNCSVPDPIPESPSIPPATLKRPSSDSSDALLPPDSKKPCLDAANSVLESSKLPTSVPSASVNACKNAQSLSENTPFLLKPQIDSFASTPKLTTAKAVAVPVQNIDIPNEKEVKTFSGLSSASDNPSLPSLSQMPPRSTSMKMEYICEWKDCGLKFSNCGSVFLHATKSHAPSSNEDVLCLWNGCDSTIRRKCFSLFTHLQDSHCNERSLQMQALRRTQLPQQGKTAPAPAPTPTPAPAPSSMPPPVHPGYAPEAAFLAIRRHAIQYLNPKELSDEKESALTKSIRLTSALILRNLSTHSSLARLYLRKFESELAYIAMSPVESARTIAQCLSLLSRTHE